MTWTVTSTRLRWPAGTVVTASDLEGLDVNALLAGGHLAGDRVAEGVSRETPPPLGPARDVPGGR